MRSLVARRLALAVALVATLLLAAGCNNPVSPDAATVNGEAISRDTLFEQANTYAALPGDPFGLQAETDNAYTASGMAAVLTTEVVDTLVAQAAERYGITADDAAVSQQDTILQQPDASGQVSPLNELTGDARQHYLEAQALRAAVFDYVGSNEWWTEEEAAAYEQLGADGQLTEVACVHHILLETEDAANDVLAQLKSGADFEALAKEKSIDTASGQNGGDLGCNPRGYFIPDFEAALDGTTAGEIVGPVTSDAGVHVIRIDQPYSAAPIDQAGTNGWIDFVLHSTQVNINPRFGTWDETNFRVIPPEGAQAPPATALNTSQ